MGFPGRASGGTLLKIGAVALALAMLFAAAVAAYALLRERPAETADRAVKAAASAEPLVRADPGIEPLKEPKVAVPEIEEPDPQLKSQPEPESRPEVEPQPEPAPEPEPRPEPEPEPETLPAQEADWPMPTEGQIEATREARQYDLPSGAALGLTIGSIGLYDVPVLRSNTQRALDDGVIHARGTSMPWSQTPERNVYLAGHRLGWPDTGSHLVFYRLDELSRGDQISLKSRDGGTYRYRVTESFVVDPSEVWVMGRVMGRDMLTLQTCTPIPGFQERLIVRAERV